MSFLVLFILAIFQSSSLNFVIKENKTVSEQEKTEIINYLENRYSEIEEKWGFRLSERITIIFFQTAYEFSKKTGYSYKTGGVFQKNTIYLQPYQTLKKKNILYSTLSHELMHACLYDYSKKGLPKWLSEGLAISFTNEFSGIRKKKNLSLKHFTDLDKLLSKSGDDPVSIYFYIGLTMQFLIEKYSHEQLIRLIKSDNWLNPEKTISQSLGEPLSAIEQNWHRYISR